MLQFIRERAQGWFAWAIITLIIVPFALWGINEYFSGGKNIAVAKVDGAEITPQQVQMAYWQQRQRYQQMLGAAFRPEMFPEEKMKQQVLQDLIEHELVVQAAGRAGMRVGDPQLAATVRGIEAFQLGGEFSRDQYERVLGAQGMPPAVFEHRLRRDLVADQFSSGVTQTAFATDYDRRQYLRVSTQSRDMGYLMFPVERFKDAVEVNDEDLATYYDAHAPDYLQPEQVRIAYVELDVDAIAAGIAVPDDELHQRYEAQKENYRATEQRRARHILITVEPGADEATEAGARTKAQELLDQLRSGGDFAALAKQHSQDPGSAGQGGDLGFFGRGVMDKAFEDSAFALAPGEVSEPVRSAFGYHLIKVEELKGGDTKPFAEVRDQILAEVRKEKAEQVFYDKAEKLANLAYEHPDTLQTAAEALQLEIKESDWFSMKGGKSGVTANQKVIGAAFSDEVLKEGNNSEAIELTTTHLVVVRTRDHKEANQPPLAEVREQVMAAVRAQKAAEKVRQMAEDAAKALREGGRKPEELAQELGITWQRNEQLTREGRAVAREVMDAVFAMPRPAQGSPTVKPVALANGTQAVVVLYAVTDGDPAKLEAADLEQAGQSLARAEGQAALDGVMAAVRARAEIRVNQPQ